MKKLLLVLLCLPLIGFGQNWYQIGSDINGETAGDWSGQSVSLSADGSTLAIGAFYNDGNGTNSGHVRVYQNVAGSWSQVGSDINGEAAGDESGSSVSLSADGSILAIGAYLNDGTNSGHVRVYQNVAGAWSQIGQDINGEAAGDESGSSVSLSADGATLAIGARENDGNGTHSGHVRVYQNVAGSWSQIGQDINGEAASDYSGVSVSLSADGATLAIGAYANDGNGTNSGHVRVYKNVAGSWSQIGSDINGEAADDYSGSSVSLSADGATLAIGAPKNSGNGTQRGHVRVYQNVAGSWSQMGQDINGEAAGDYSGHSVSLSDDGATLAIGAYANDGNGTNSGHVRVYKNVAGSWSQIGSDINGEAADDYSGYSVSLSADGATLAIGAFYNDGNGADAGHVRIFNFKTTKTELKHFVEQKINQWELKGEFETTSDYGLRVNDKTRAAKITEFQEEAINTLKSNFLNSLNFSNIELGAYDADKQTFLLKAKDSKVGNLVLFVPINEAPNFKATFSKYKYLNPQSEFIDAKFVLSHVDVVFGKKTYSYDIPNNICTSGDCENGYGVFTSAEGTYKGNWKNGKVHGTGVFVGILYTYDGQYVNGQQHGQGKKTFTNGKIEEGTFENGNFLGK